MKFSCSPDHVSGPHRGQRILDRADRPEPRRLHHSASADRRPAPDEQEREWAEFDRSVDNDHDGLG